MPEQPIDVPIVRGHEHIQKEDLRGHLALALRLENVGVLLGAGASVEAGGVVMRELWEDHVPQSTKSWLRSNNFAPEESNTLNIERILSRLELALADAERRSDGAPELRGCMKTLNAAVIKAALLLPELWEDRRSAAASIALQPFNLLLARLQGSRQPGQSAPWCFSLNYDLAIDWAAEALGIHVVNGFTGIHDRRFQPNAFDLSLQNVRATGEARFGSYNLNLVKLHGSLSWRLRPDNEAVEVPCASAWPEIQSALDGAMPEVPPLLVLPTTAKYVESVGFIYGELIRRFTEFLARANSVLIVSGYGFNDDHINRLLASGLLNPTLQLVIYYPEWSAADDPIPNDFLRHVHSLGLPRVIIHGGAEKAFFRRMTEDLPDPAMVDELSDDVKRMLRRLGSPQAVPTEGK